MRVLLSPQGKSSSEPSLTEQMKCDLEDPCANCRKVSRECVPAVRQTKPRSVPCDRDFNSRSRPTHDQIEQLQSKVTDLENLLRAVSDAEPVIASEALRSWRQSGSINAVTNDNRSADPDLAPSQAVDAQANADAEAAFDTPSADQYIYDTIG